MSVYPESMPSREWDISSLMTYSILLAVTLTYLYHQWQQRSHMVKLGRLFPGPKELPIIGNAHIMIGKRPQDIIETLLDLDKGYGPVARAWLGYYLIVFLMDPRDVEVILGSQVHIDKSDEYRFFKPWLGNGLLISTGDKWKAHRKMIAPTFHLNILKSFMGVFNKNSVALCERLKSKVGNIFDVHDNLSAVTVDILLETAMGVTKQTDDNAGFDYAMAVMKMCSIIHQRQFKFWLRSEMIFNNFSHMSNLQKKLLATIHGLTEKVFQRRKAEYKSQKGDSNVEITNGHLKNDPEISRIPLTNEKKTGLRDDLDEIDENDIGEKRRLAFLDLMMEASHSGTDIISDQEIKEQVDTIMFEGHDTTAAGSSFVLCLLGIHQNIQAKVYRELYEIFGDDDREVTFQDTTEMKYLERVILETLRLYPPVPAIARMLKEDVQLASTNLVIPKGTTVLIPTFKLHRTPEIYPNPLVFDPDNFLPEKSQVRHYYSFIPFSAGPRSCVGRKYAMLKLKVLLSTVLRNYRILSDLTEKDFKLQADIILKRTDGFRIQIEPRVRQSV